MKARFYFFKEVYYFAFPFTQVILVVTILFYLKKYYGLSEDILLQTFTTYLLALFSVSIVVSLIIISWLIFDRMVSLKESTILRVRVRPKPRFQPKPKPKSKSGYIYLIRRQDGIYKIGYSSNITSRLEQLAKQWKQSAILIKKWVVDDMQKAERTVLELSANCYYLEGRSIEYRKMNDKQIEDFIELLGKELPQL